MCLNPLYNTLNVVSTLFLIINPHTLERIADALHVDVHQFYEPTRDKDDTSTKAEYADFLNDDEMKILIADYAKVCISLQ